ncbi:MAG: bifunctional 5,10-methylenetetrahydrofolate dehydrogenase/5,10-methenyltetrahydrofolate cyclohydrolase [Bacilli bacterium]|jgi:methylenetetrahydrofolate dehydrogenase (NADP+)/methenyltetrahydrofolate cyclohydrolase|nr:bifunctional 5,10-methylenetetrahydrofolate dehydrogenase/5,10-methenyltetrahydrofolate cyclohydrolase [Bacilli bacterium]MDD4005817.1 bifunctional 5,10-methylenetetrahydrofolate dehydrogenase/5,10-methenyltetrahydrofolate cyclohydrolase [Bacilli bacterium]
MEIKEYVAMRKQQIRDKVASMKIRPHLAIVQVNEDEGSNSYIRGKLKDAEELGVRATHIKLPVETSEQEVLELVNSLNLDPDIHGFIVQMPLPKHINEDKVKVAINPSKDVDGFHPLSKLKACTPRGILDYLKFSNIELLGKNAVVIGRSNIVGKPMAALLTKESANVTILHSKTKPEDFRFYVEHADLIVAAVGKKWLVDGYNFKKEAVIVDVGINRIDGVLYGDVKPGQKVRLQTPVPGGVGPLTRLALFENLMEIMEHGI